MTDKAKTGYILGISRGHNAGVCLLKDGKIVFAIEEERLSRAKYDGGPYAAMIKVKEYTDKVDIIIVAHTQSLKATCGKVDYMGDDVYTGLARKLGLIERKADYYNHPQVIDMSAHHHRIHAACAFYRSGFTDAVAVVADGAGSCLTANFNNDQASLWEVESVFSCEYPAEIKTLYKHFGTREAIPTLVNHNASSEQLGESGTHIEIMSGHAGITKVYEAITEYCGFQAIEAGKTMGLFPYGKPNDKIPPLFNNNTNFKFPLSDKNVIVPRYPNGAILNWSAITELSEPVDQSMDLSLLESRRDMAYALQHETQEQLLKLILTAVELSGKKNVVLSGGFGLNCVANYSYLPQLKEQGIELYVEPISNDGGTAIGAALLYHYASTNDMNPQPQEIYLGPQYTYSTEEIDALAEQFKGTVTDATDQDVVDLMTSKNIVAIFQGRSENGPRALGNRSLMFDPTFEDGKDFVNEIKHREYFRPFAGSILEEDAHEWFDLRGMPASPHMMYAVNCKPGVAEKIPSIIHVDGTCRIQTVNEIENPLYYKVIKKFKETTGVPIIFNTSFNLGGEPLVETLEDALWTLQQSRIEYLYLPEYGKLITVNNWKMA
jgi:carbamoyltransferase